MNKLFTLILIPLIATSCSFQPNGQIESTTTSKATIQSYGSTAGTGTTDMCEQYLLRLQANDSTVVAPLEQCLKLKNNAFKKFPIPLNTDDYYAFMGNSPKEEDRTPVCNSSLRYEDCLFYKVVAGKPYLIANVSATTSEPDRTNIFDKFGALGEIIGIKQSAEAISFHGLMGDLGYCWPKGCGMATTAQASFYVQDIEKAFRSESSPGRSLVAYNAYEPLQEDLKTSYADITFYPNPNTPVTIDLRVASENTVQMKYGDKIIATLSINKSLLQEIGNTGFLSLDDLKNYAFSENLKQFSFSLGSLHYILDLQSETPKLLKK